MEDNIAIKRDVTEVNFFYYYYYFFFSKAWLLSLITIILLITWGYVGLSS